MVGVERCLSYKGTCHVILLAKLHDMYLYKTDTFFHINHYLKSVSKVALLHRFHCMCPTMHAGITIESVRHQGLVLGLEFRVRVKFWVQG